MDNYVLTEEDKKAMNIAKDILGTGRYINFMTGKGAGDVSKVLDGDIIERLELIKENQQKARIKAVEKYDKQRLEEEVKRQEEKRKRDILEKRKISSEVQKRHNEEIEQKQNKAREDEQQNTLNRLLRNRLNNAKGGSIPQQMELFQEGGLKDEGGTIDPVSGNDVPSGSTQEEVRDDIPAQLSEGEFVFPADVVRYIGLEKLMMIRQRAKAGLQRMEEMGQMGNSEEAIL
jgi:hypothetical protein